MEKKNFEKLVDQIRDEPLPDCPASLESNVLRRIRLAADEASRSLFDWVLGLVPQPGFVFAAFAMTVAISLSNTIISTNLHADVVQTDQVASKALDFDVFQGKDYLNLDEQ